VRAFRGKILRETDVHDLVARATVAVKNEQSLSAEIVRVFELGSFELELIFGGEKNPH
jgi:hypothetical protein